MRQRQSKDIPYVSIADEPLVLTQSDMDRSNFGVDTAGRPVILDPEAIGWLPESMELFALFGPAYFAHTVAEHFDAPEAAARLQTRSNLRS